MITSGLFLASLASAALCNVASSLIIASVTTGSTAICNSTVTLQKNDYFWVHNAAHSGLYTHLLFNYQWSKLLLTTAHYVCNG